MIDLPIIPEFSGIDGFNGLSFIASMILFVQIIRRELKGQPAWKLRLAMSVFIAWWILVESSPGWAIFWTIFWAVYVTNALKERDQLKEGSDERQC